MTDTGTTLYVYARHPDRKLWVVFFKDSATGTYHRVCSYRTNPSSYGYKRVDWPEKYENAPITENIKITP